MLIFYRFNSQVWLVPLVVMMCTQPLVGLNDQQILGREVTLQLEDVPLSRALVDIDAVAGVKLVYSPSHLDLEQTITIATKRKSLGLVLEDLFRPISILYTVDKQKEFILLRPSESPGRSPANGGMGSGRHPVPSPVKGKITDAQTQMPIAGANVIVKGTTRGTTTDSNGTFTIEAEDDDVLVFSFIGYKQFQTQVGGRSMIDVMMEPDVQALDAVTINAGYYTTTFRKKTGNIARVTAKEIGTQPVTNPLLSLQGRMAGVDITPYNGVPGGAVKIQIRGRNSLRPDGANPLYVVDGVPIDSNPLRSGSTSVLQRGFDPLSTINPANIESIEILKDAAATSIYGSRGANGVILVTTKQGKMGKPVFDLAVYKGAGEIVNRLDLLNTEQYLAMRNEALANDGLETGDFDFDINGAWDTSRETDWQEQLLGNTSHVNDLSGGISFGDDNSSFRLSAGYHSESSVLLSDDFGYELISASMAYNYSRQAIN